MTSSIVNRFSTLATDPLRSFRFYAEFTQSGPDKAMSPKILTASGTAKSKAGSSNGWIGGFSNISGLSINTQAIPYREGGYNTTVHQVPGMTTFQPISFQRGVLYGNDQAITWMRGLFAAAAGEGIATGTSAQTSKSFRVDVKLYVMDHPNAAGYLGNRPDQNTPRMGFKIHNAWITTLNYTDLNAADGAILFENMTLVHEGLSVFFTDEKFGRLDNVKN